MHQYARQLIRLAALAIVFSSMLGCAYQPVEPERVSIVPMPVLIPTESLHARVDWIKLDKHAVIARIDGYRHALSFEPVDESGDVSGQAAPAFAHSPAPESVPYVDSDADAASEVIDAWQRLCTGRGLDAAQKKIIFTTHAPWGSKDECVKLHRAAIHKKEMMK